MTCSLSTSLEAFLDNIFIYFLPPSSKSASTVNITVRVFLGFRGFIFLHTARLVLLSLYRAKNLICMMLKRKNLFCWFLPWMLYVCVELCSFPPWGWLFRKSEQLAGPKYLHFNILLNDHLALSTQYNRSQLWDSLKTRRDKYTERLISSCTKKSNHWSV